MKIDLKESQVSLTGGKFFLWLRRGRIRLVVLLLMIAAATAAVLHITRINTFNSDNPVPEQDDDGYYMLWQHYSSFDMSDPHVKVKLDSKSDEIYLMDNAARMQYNFEVYPKNVRDKIDYEWRTSNDVIAPVNDSGLVETVVPGEAEITVAVKYDGKEYTDTAKLRIIQPVSGIYMPTTTIEIYNGSAGRMITAAASPENASNKKLIWKTDNDKIATVDENGYVKPVSTGLTKIHAMTEDGGYEGQCFVNVINYEVKVDSVTIQNEYKDDARLKAGELLRVSAEVAPSNAKNKTLKWSSTNSAVASVSQTGIVHASEVGETYIVASSNGKQDIMKLTVEPGSEGDRLNLHTEEESDEMGVPVLPYIGAEDGTVTYTDYSKTLDEMVNIQMAQNPPPKANGGQRLASRTEVEQHMDPAYYHDGAYKYQFLDLSCPNNVSASELNKYLEGKGVLEGHAQDFIDAANKYNLSELYLVTHAILETGNGSSALARGVEVEGTKVYNVFGIGAYDNSALYSGSRRAYKEGWTSVGAAIVGGAKFISDMYVNASAGRQNTLYKMLFNPGNPGEHQYATDCEWAVSQATILDRLFRLFPNAVKTYEIPVYAGMTPVILDVNE